MDRPLRQATILHSFMRPNRWKAGSRPEKVNQAAADFPFVISRFRIELQPPTVGAKSADPLIVVVRSHAILTDLAALAPSCAWQPTTPPGGATDGGLLDDVTGPAP